ncbi:MAG: riboflavin biosynthesis protein RibF [Clostridia bacterium]|nr:riboflavin biosynthesis protein RibF [Clostridia bacterium]
MKTVTLANAIPKEGKTGIALGMFDGVHMGHRRIITAAKNKSTELGIPSSVLLFSKSPRNAPMLLPLRDRLSELEKLGVDYVYVYDFDEISHMSPEEFVRRELCDRLGAAAVFAGYNYRFGKGAVGTAETLKELCGARDIFCGITDEVKFLGGSVSSSRIRKLLAEGDVETANMLLTYPYYLRGEVLHGKELGRNLGLPTINQRLDADHTHMARGIYYTKTVIDSCAYLSVSNLGVRPTVEDTEIVNLETHIIDFDGDLYGREVKVEFHGKGRGEMRFDSVEELRIEVMRDCERAIEFFK